MEDLLVKCFLNCCGLVQEMNEIDSREENPNNIGINTFLLKQFTEISRIIIFKN